MTGTKARHVGWRDENIRVQDARRPFLRRTRQLLQVDGFPAIDTLPSERRTAAGIDTFNYYSYPLLFYTLFPNVSLGQLRQLSVCGAYLFDYILCLDRLIDHAAINDVGTLLLSNSLQREATAQLYDLFPPNHIFWTYFDAYYAHFVQATLRERARHHCLVTPYDAEDLQQIYAGKAAVAKACVAALALLNGSEEDIRPLTESHDAFYIGFQVLDDLHDWHRDYMHQHYSYPLTLAFMHGDWKARVESGHRPGLDEVATLLHTSGAVEQSLALALGCLDQAEHLLGAMPEGSWAAAIQQTRQRIRRFRLVADDIGATAEAPGQPSGDSISLAGALPVPIARSWRGWLDSRRAPTIPDPSILAVQQQCLAGAGHASTLGEVICHVGLAISASLACSPEQHPAAHLGISRAEFDWCRHNSAWLEAALALAVDEPAELWAPTAGDETSDGWLSPAIGRFLGYHLVQVYRHDSAPDAIPGAAVLLQHYRRHLIA